MRSNLKKNGRSRREEGTACLERVRFLFEHARDIIFLLTREGRILEANYAAVAAYGYTRRELLHMRIFDLRHPGTMSSVFSQMQEASQKGLLFETMHRRRDGTPFPVEVNSQGFLFGGQRVLLSVIRDISERKQAEASLRSAHKKLLDIIDFLPDATFVIDRNRRVIAWNQAIEKMTGVPKEDILGQGDFAYALPFYGSPRPALIDHIFTGDGEAGKNYHYFQQNSGTLCAEVFVPGLYGGRGAYLWLKASPLYDDQGRLVGAIEAVRDITDYKQMEEELRRHRKHLEDLVEERTNELKTAEERFSKIFTTSPCLTIILSQKSERILHVNDAFKQITGYHPLEAIGRKLSEIHVWAGQEERDRLYRVALERGSLRNLEIHFLTKCGKQRVGLVSAELIELNGEPCVLGLLNDITERKQLEREITRLDRLNLVGEMAAGIGHEIRNPMTTVRGFLQMLGEKEDCLKYKDYFDLMIDELDRSNTIISEFLAMAKNKPIDKKAHNLNGIVEALAPLLKANAMVSDMDLDLQLQAIPDLYLDEKEIRQLILNLVRNGFEAMPQGGTLTIQTVASPGEVVLSVQDQGQKIKPEVLDKIGTPFFTTKDYGTGLGSAVCYSIAARHHATIKINSTCRGTVFSVHFKA